MLTKRQFAEILFKCECEALGINTCEFREALLYQSSTLAVVSEYLGLLETPQAKDYAASRGGSFLQGFDSKEEYCQLSVRDILKVLPE